MEGYNMKKRILAMLLAGIMVVGLTACGSSESTTSTDSGTSTSTESTTPASDGATDAVEEAAFEGTREVVVGISADIKTWEPWGAYNIGRQNMAPMIYQNLTADIIDPDSWTMTHYDVMAESEEQIGERTYQIKIREGIVDSAGNAFTASDAIFSFEGCRAAGKMTQANAIESMELVDELTFNMTLTEAGNTEGNFEDICSAINMVTQASYEASADGMSTDPIGTGPMVLASYTSGSDALLTKADSFWNEAANETRSTADGYCSMWDMSNIDQIHYVFITDEASMAIALENGEIDIARAISMEDKVLFEDSDAYTLFVEPEGSYGLAFNVSSNSPTSNYNLRMAIAYCIDAEGVLNAACDGDGEVAVSWSYPSFSDYQSAWESEEYFDYNLDTAKEYLDAYCAETGVAASSISLRLLLQSEDIAEGVASAIQYYVGELTGNPSTVEIMGYDRATTTQMKADATAYDLFIVNGQLVTRITSCYDWDSVANYAKSGWTIFHEEDNALQEKLLAAIEVETHSDETVYDFQAYVKDQCYHKNLIYANEYGAAASWIGNEDAHIGSKGCLNLGALSYDWNASGK